jgi:metal-sulfur cluster biosynthetic enzyme
MTYQEHVMSIPEKGKIIKSLKAVKDPEIHLDVVDLGLVYDIDIDTSGKVTVRMTLTTPACPYGETLLAQAHHAVENVDDVTDVEIVLVWDPPWDPKEMCSDHAKDELGIW